MTFEYLDAVATRQATSVTFAQRVADKLACCVLQCQAHKGQKCLNLVDGGGSDIQPTQHQVEH